MQPSLYESVPLSKILSKHALIAMGANLPSGTEGPAETLRHALSQMAEAGLKILCVSRFYTTPCFPPGAGPDYVNAAVLVDAGEGFAPSDVLQTLHRIEAQNGRQRLQRWGMRTLDLDLIAMGDLVLPDAAHQARWRELSAADQARLAPDQLILPHPRLQDRAFVLVPLADVAPDWRHPVLGRSVVEMLAALPDHDKESVVAL